MSFEVTKNDLSCNKAKIDLKSIEQGLKNYYWRLWAEIRNMELKYNIDFGDTEQDVEKRISMMTSSQSEQLIRLAKLLQKTAENISVIQGCYARENITILKE